MPTQEIGERLREAGLRVTGPRVAVLAVLDSARDHPRVDQLIERARADGVSISTQAAYDVCDALHGAGLARRIEPAGGPARYESRVGDNHHHLVCRACGLAVDVDCVAGAAPCLDPRHTSGFRLDEAEVTFWGLCPDCRDDTGPRQPEPADDRRPRSGAARELPAPREDGPLRPRGRSSKGA